MTYALNIAEMLTYRRPHDSQGEAEFVARYIAPHALPIAADDGTVHAYAVTIPGNPSVAFCAHTDSVHNRQHPHVHQRVAWDPALNHYLVADKDQRDCLGADNAAGCYVLLRMIAAKVPGLYLFFRGEERGGIGSGWVAEHRADLLDGIRAAIQFDRRGTRSVITHMAVGRTCSDAFGRSLARVLDMGHELDDGGSFTDTANLSELVPECTNVSCGYDHEHGPREMLDAGYLDRLADACIRAFQTPPELTIERTPGDYDRTPWPAIVPRGRPALTLAANDDDDDDPSVLWIDDNVSHLLDMDADDVYDFVHWGDPDEILDMLLACREALR